MFCALFSTCVKELIPDKNGYKPEIVVWTILDPDSTITVITTGNRGINPEDKVNIPSIDFFLYEDSLKVETLFSQKISSTEQIHTFSHKAQSGKKYTLKIFNQEFDLSATTRIPERMKIPLNLSLTKGENARLSYSLLDDPVQSDAYQFDIKMVNSGILRDSLQQTILDSEYVYIENFLNFDEPSLNYNLLGLNIINTGNYTYPVSDLLFNGKSKEFLFTISNPVSKFIKVPRQLADPPMNDLLECKKRFAIVRSRNISPDYYKFISSENQNNGIFGTPYFNPTNLYSNVSGGLGLMAAVSERTDTIWVFK
ncbi:MAG: DUF4249 family protein [Flavobacteriales bacterium]|nr:DUF4249 family protein [Flavobacteriales bacterium]